MLTLPDVLAAYRKSSPDGRVFLRDQYPRLHLEFDAIEREEDRAARMNIDVKNSTLPERS